MYTAYDLLGYTLSSLGIMECKCLFKAAPDPTVFTRFLPRQRVVYTGIVLFLPHAPFRGFLSGASFSGCDVKKGK